MVLSSCDELEIEPSCSDQGTLQVCNKSLHTVQKIIINNTNYGTIDPDECKDIKLAVGTYTLRMEGVSGGNGCNIVSTFIIAECDNIGRSCSH